MKLFAACLSTETNTFSSLPTGFGSFSEGGLYFGDGSIVAACGAGAFISYIRRAAAGHQIIESVTAVAQPGGLATKRVYESLRDRILSDLRSALPVDIVQLTLHGAMVADGYDDCEGDLLTHIRNIVGPEIAVGAVLDLHCHLTTEMLSAADALVAFKEYPHTDAAERTEELTRILVAKAQGKSRPTTAVFDCQMVGIYHTTREPMASFVRLMQATEKQDRILSVSLGHGFPWGDVPSNGTKLWVIADDDSALAARLARELGKAFIDHREATVAETVSFGEALYRVGQTCGLAVIADVADNPGGGAPGDSTFILREMLDRRIARAAMGAMWDPNAVQICREAGVGATIRLRLGGKCGPTSGDPIDIDSHVMALSDEHSQRSLDGRSALGASAWIRTGEEVDILVSSIREQITGVDAFTNIGIDLSEKRVVVVKSTQHFFDDFSKIAGSIQYASTPGSLSSDYASIPFSRRDLDYWPRVARPSAWNKIR